MHCCSCRWQQRKGEAYQTGCVGVRCPGRRTDDSIRCAQAYDGEFGGDDDGGSASDDDDEEGGGLDGDVGSLTARALMSAERAAPPRRGATEKLRSVSPLKPRGKTLNKTCALVTSKQAASSWDRVSPADLLTLLERVNGKGHAVRLFSILS